MRKTNGFSLIEVLIVAAVLLIIVGAITIPSQGARYSESFNKHFGVAGQRSWISDEAARNLVQPLVGNRLEELKKMADGACRFAIEIPESPTAENANAALQELNSAREKCEGAAKEATDATDEAHHYGFNVDAGIKPAKER